MPRPIRRFDIDGIDAAHKLAILAALAFARPVDFAAVHVEGIRGVSALDIGFANELGYRIKLLGIAERVGEGISQRVHPCLVPQSRRRSHGSTACLQRGGGRGRFRRPADAGGQRRRRRADGLRRGR